MMSDDAAIKPTVSELNHKLRNLVDWEEFGLNLPKVCPAFIQKIKYDKCGIDEQKPALYYEWLKLYPQATWNDVITALKEIEEHTIVETLTKELHHTSKISLKPIIDIQAEQKIISDDSAKRPTVPALCNKLHNLVDWEGFAIHLPRVSTNVIKKVRKDYPLTITNQKQAIFTEWLKRYPEASWDDVIHALEVIEENSIVRTLTQELHQTSRTASNSTVVNQITQEDSPNLMELTVSNLAETLHHLVRWQNVAIHLPHVTSTHIARIERDFPHNTGLQLISMFTEWLDKCPQASWYDVLQALVKAGEIKLTDNLHEKLRKENQEFVNHYWCNNKLLPTVIEHSYSKTSLPCSVFSIVDRFVNEEDVFFSTDTTATSISEEDRALVASTDGIDESSESEAFSTAITSTMLHLRLNSTELSPEMEAILLNESESSEDKKENSMYIQGSLSLINPTGPLQHKSHRILYLKVFNMAWNGEDQKALRLVKEVKRDKSYSVDLKVVCMEVVHTVNSERDLKMLLSALAYTDRTECENKLILKCRLHRRIAGLYYRSGDTECASDHLVTALQLAEQLKPDIDSIYTMRLQALLLFEEYKKTRDTTTRKGAEKYFQRAMDHARKQPDWKRLITERIKISKALFHLDMISMYQDMNMSNEEAIEQLQYRAQDALSDVDDAFLTDRDKAFFYLTFAKLKRCSEACDLAAAKSYAKMALDINNRRKEAEQLLRDIEQLL